MGCGSSSEKNQPVSYKFKNGKPAVKGDQITPMFNNLIYRISDHKSGRWAFYNDSADQVVHIAILFEYDSQIVPLGETTAFRIDDPDDGCEDDYGKYLCEIDVRPGETQMFVEGTITGWRVDTMEARNNENERVYRL